MTRHHRASAVPLRFLGVSIVTVAVVALLLLQSVQAHAAALTAPAAIPLTSSSCPADIQEGQISGCVTELQTLLNKNGARLTVDGNFGPLTLAAVRSYQASHGLSVDGIVGPQTKASLDSSRKAPTAGAPAPINLESSACPADIQEGQISGCVTELQTLLNRNGAGLTVDGNFGPLTLAAVRSYQSSHALAVDGIVGPNTKAALYGQKPPAPQPPPPTSGGGNSAIVAAAKKLVDQRPAIPYVWGGGHGAHPGATRDPNCHSDSTPLACQEPYVSEIGYDCSGFDREVLYMAGYGDVGAGNTSVDQTLGSNVPGWSSRSIGSSVQPGDIIVFSDLGPGGTSTHTGIYVGNGQLAQAPQTGQNVDFGSVNGLISGGDYVVAVRRMPQPKTTTPVPQPPAQNGVVDNSGAGLSTNYDFARLVLRDGGWPVTSNNVTVITQWMTSEEPTSNWFDRDNPLNNGLGSGGGAGLGSYPNLHTAAYYIAKNLSTRQFGYGAVVDDLKASAAPSTTARAIWDSDWASSHYGYGRSWATATAPTVATPRGVAW